MSYDSVKMDRRRKDAMCISHFIYPLHHFTLFLLNVSTSHFHHLSFSTLLTRYNLLLLLYTDWNTSNIICDQLIFPEILNSNLKIIQYLDILDW